jgi:mannose-6-phosphate isomerase-like protein (cupin superfamily)
MTTLNALVRAWGQYLTNVLDWRQLVRGVKPVSSSRGLQYEVRNPFRHYNERLTIVDMSELHLSEPHRYLDELEVYFVLQGTGKMVVGNEALALWPHGVVVVPPGALSIICSYGSLVLAVVHRPLPNPANYVRLSYDDSEVRAAVALLE